MELSVSAQPQLIKLNINLKSRPIPRPPSPLHGLG